MTASEVIKLLFNKLKPVQQDMFKKFFSSNGRKYIIHCSRRLGKTHLLCVIAICVALSKPNAQIRYATFTQKSLKKMVLPIFKTLFDSIPKKYSASFNVQDGSYKFKNGSQIHLAGVNNGRSDTLRGTSADLALVDEAAFVDELTYLTESVLMPQLLTVENSKLIMASSSPISPSHEFVDYISQAKTDGYYSSYTIYDAGYAVDLVQEFCSEAGGANSTTWKREYLNAIVTDETLAIIPEWDSRRFVQMTDSDEVYSLYHKYCSADWGVRDKTAILWATYDFKKATLIVEAEYSCSGQDSTTRNIANNIIDKEKILGWTNVYRRPADNNNLILLQDLGSEFNIHFYPTNKDTLAAMINEVRLWVGQGRILVNPNCVELISCLEFGVFQDQKRREFGRSKTLGHYDMLASLVYLVRNVDQHTNPIPSTHGTNVFTHYTPPNETESFHQIKKIFNL